MATGLRSGPTDVIDIIGDANWDRHRIRMHSCQGRDQVACAAATGWTVFEAPMPQYFARAVAHARDGLVIDVGANTGYYTLLALAVSRKVKVAAYEPLAEVRALLEANLALQPTRRRARVYTQAVSSRTGSSTLFVPDGSHGLIETSASLSETFKGGVRHARDVQAATLDSLHRGASKIAVIKIDAESHDLDVLLGAEHILKTHKPVIFLEVLFGADEIALTRVLQRCGYADVALRPGHAAEPGDTVVHHPDGWNHMWLPKDLASRPDGWWRS